MSVTDVLALMVFAIAYLAIEVLFWKWRELNVSL